MRLEARIATVLAISTLAFGPARLALGAPSVIGPPPTTSRTRTSVVTISKAEAQAQLDAQRKTYEEQVAALKEQVTSLKERVTELEDAGTSNTEDVAALSETNGQLREDYTKLYEAQNANLATIDRLTTDNERLAHAVEGLRPPAGRDWIDWAALVAGVVAGGLLGLRFGIKRGEDRAVGGIPPNVAAWWGGESREPPQDSRSA